MWIFGDSTTIQRHFSFDLGKTKFVKKNTLRMYTSSKFRAAHSVYGNHGFVSLSSTHIEILNLLHFEIIKYYIFIVLSIIVFFF